MEKWIPIIEQTDKGFDRVQVSNFIAAVIYSLNNNINHLFQSDWKYLSDFTIASGLAWDRTWRRSIGREQGPIREVGQRDRGMGAGPAGSPPRRRWRSPRPCVSASRRRSRGRPAGPRSGSRSGSPRPRGRWRTRPRSTRAPRNARGWRLPPSHGRRVVPGAFGRDDFTPRTGSRTRRGPVESGGGRPGTTRSANGAPGDGASPSLMVLRRSAVTENHRIRKTRRYELAETLTGGRVPADRGVSESWGTSESRGASSDP